MATTVCASATTVRERPSTLTELPHLNTASNIIPNKHLPYCSPGPRPSPRQLENTPLSPQRSNGSSILYPPDIFARVSDEPPVYRISAEQVARAIDHASSQPLPPPQQVFPWLHGLHAENQIQLAFFTARKKALCRTPKCIRGLTVVKAGGNLDHSRLKGAIGPEEILYSSTSAGGRSSGAVPTFVEIDPKDGFSVRNFQIQACKMATVSDIIVYGDDKTSREDIESVARTVSEAQASWQRKSEGDVKDRLFNTFLVHDTFATFEENYSDLVVIQSNGAMTSHAMDFFNQERIEMCTMSSPTEISHNVWLGPTPDVSFPSDASPCPDFDVMIEANDMAQIPEQSMFEAIEDLLCRREKTGKKGGTVPQIEFPGSGAILPPTWSQSEADGLIAMCEWIHHQAHDIRTRTTGARRDSKLSLGVDEDGDQYMSSHEPDTPSGRRVLIHCTDGYTESSLLGLAYYMYAECKPAHDAWVDLHTKKRRNFFAYASDVALLRAIQPRLLQSSPRHTGDLQELCPSSPEWLNKMDGSLPSRILDYMYLGNLGHANNPGLLRELGIGQVLSVGEPLTWTQEVCETWPRENLLYIDRVQDNGVDPLTAEFSRCLDFIENGRRKGTATLVHCRVGVSRSATICIAEVMRETGLSFPRAYCFVRARRLNVIIQPHLRFSYELLKWEEAQCQQRGERLKRELEWATIAREIAAMNRPYSRHENNNP